MGNGQRANSRGGPLRPIVGLGTRAAAITLRPLAGAAALTMRPVAGAAALTMRPITGAAEAAFGAGRELERRAVDRVLDSHELERLTGAALDSPRTQAALRTALDSEGAKQLVTVFFESRLFDELVDQLLESQALWRMIDEIAASPAVTAAITQQSLGFMDQVQDVARARSRNADDWLERRARRLAWWRARQREAAAGPKPGDAGPEPGDAAPGAEHDGASASATPGETATSAAAPGP